MHPLPDVATVHVFKYCVHLSNVLFVAGALLQFFSLQEAVGVPLHTHGDPLIVYTQAKSVSAAPQDVVFCLQPPPFLVIHPDTNYSQSAFVFIVFGAAAQSLFTQAVPVQ